MTIRVPLLGAALAALLLALPARAQDKKPPSDDLEAAQLAPASALAYVELRHPDRFAKELLALTKGSSLEDMAATMARARAKLGDRDDLWWLSDMLGFMGMFGGPEFLDECGKLKGGFFALTGFSKDGPEMVAVLLSGSSNAPKFFMRTYLSVDAEMRAREEVEGILTYQARRRDWNRFGGPGGAVPGQQPAFTDSGPVCAIIPGGIVLGTREATHDVLRRLKGKAKTESLIASAAYKSHGKLLDKPGLYFHADVPALAKQMDSQFQGAKGPDAAMWASLKSVVNPAAFKTVSGNLSLSGGSTGLQVHLDLNAQETSPVLDLLPDRKGSLDLLNAAPADSLLAFTLSLPDGATRWQKFLALMDKVAKEQGAPEQGLPSKAVRELEQKVKLQLGKELFGQINNVGLYFDMRASVPDGAVRMPTLILGAVDAEAAKVIDEQLLAKIIAMLGNGEGDLPTREKILDLSISMLPDPTKAFGVLAYGRSGKVVVIGQDRKAVAEALVRHSKKEGVLAHKSAGPALEKLDSPVGAGSFSVGQSLVAVLRELETPRVMMAQKVAPGLPPGAQPPPPPDAPKKPEKPKTFDKYVNQMVKLAEGMPVGVISLTRTKERLSLEASYPDLRPSSAKVIDVWVESALERALRERRGFGVGVGVGGGDAPAVDLPLPPPPPEKKE